LALKAATVVVRLIMVGGVARQEARLEPWKCGGCKAAIAVADY